jgi:COMPASS component SPP1
MQCVDIPELEVDLVDQFFCPLCIQSQYLAPSGSCYSAQVLPHLGNPHLSLRTTYKQRCLNGLKHSNPKSPDACHKPALGGGILSKFCSQDCGVEHMANRIDAWVKKGGKREKLWESVKDAEKREGVVIQVDRPNPRIAEITVKTEDSKPMVLENQVKEETKSVLEKLQVKATKSTLEIERLRIVLARVVKMREEIKKGMEVVLWREQLLELATERAQVVGQCGWDQRLCFGDEEWAEFGMGILESYESKEGSTAERDNDMQVDGPGVSEDGEWWCPGKTVCDRHVG